MKICGYSNLLGKMFNNDWMREMGYTNLSFIIIKKSS
jgi:hypothetical protein